MPKDGGRNTLCESKSVIRLKAVTSADRQRLRIPVYKYLLP